MTEELAAKHCVPCSGGVPALKGDDLTRLHAQVPVWKLVDEHHLERHYEFENFASALELVNRIGEIAESEGHHPDIAFGWGYADIKIFTHAARGLTESDFILAAKIDRL